MIVINTMKDIEYIKKQERLPDALVEELEDYFKYLVKNLTGKEVSDSYSLEEKGSIFVLEQKDNPRKMDELGLSEEDEGLFGSTPEFVTVLEIGEMKYYKTVIACNNSSAIVIYSAAGMFGEELDEFLKEYVID